MQSLYDSNPVKGPFFYGVLKDGTVRSFAKKPNRPHVIEYFESVDGFGQNQWHYLTANPYPDNRAHVGQKIDFNSHCGFDRGPRFDNIIRRLLK